MNVILILCDTLRRDHCGPYHQGRPLSVVTGDGQPDWVIPTPNLDRLAARGTTFDNCWCGSSPCMPARRDLHTGRFEFLERGWGPLEDDDLDLARQISGPPNQSLAGKNEHISQLVTDHFHLWEQGSGNYHMGFSGFEFIRGMEADAFSTDPIEFPLPSESFRHSKTERHYRNVAQIRTGADGELDESKWFAPQTFTTAAQWLTRNRSRKNFFLHIDSFSPHEPWDPPEHLVKQFDSRGYEIPEYFPSVPYAAIDSQNGLSADQARHVQALYAASVVHMDQNLGRLFDTLDELDLWKETLVIFTTDHGTYNGDRNLLGKLQTHQFDAVSHLPLILAHPTLAHGERRSQLTQLVDLYPTTLAAVGRPIPEKRHGIDLLPCLADANAPTRDFALAGIFGQSITLTDGRWVLHQQPNATNSPLYWYSHHLPLFISYKVHPFENGRRAVEHTPFAGETWLSDKSDDPNELTNLAASYPDQLQKMQAALAQTLHRLGAPAEQLERLDLTRFEIEMPRS